MYVCPSEPHTPSPSLGHSSSVRHLQVTEPSAFPVQAALFLQSLARSHGPERTTHTHDFRNSVTQNGQGVRALVQGHNPGSSWSLFPPFYGNRSDFQNVSETQEVDFESPKYYLGEHTPDPSKGYRLWHSFRKLVTVYPRSAPAVRKVFFYTTCPF